VVGEINRGWYVSMTTLNNERSTAYLGSPIRFRRQLEQLADLARRTERRGRPLSEDPVIRQKLAQCYIDVQSFQYAVYRTVSARIRGDAVGPEASSLKLNWSEMMQKISELALEIEGPFSQVVRGSSWALDDGLWPHLFLSTRSATIAGGTSEIQRNILGDRILGMPR